MKKKQLIFVLKEKKNIPMADARVRQMSQCEIQVSCVGLTAKLEQKCCGVSMLNVFYKLVSSVHVGTEADMAEKLLLLFSHSGRGTLLLKVLPPAVFVCAFRKATAETFFFFFLCYIKSVSAQGHKRGNIQHIF